MSSSGAESSTLHDASRLPDALRFDIELRIFARSSAWRRLLGGQRSTFASMRSVVLEECFVCGRCVDSRTTNYVQSSARHIALDLACFESGPLPILDAFDDCRSEVCLAVARDISPSSRPSSRLCDAALILFSKIKLNCTAKSIASYNVAQCLIKRCVLGNAVTRCPTERKKILIFSRRSLWSTVSLVGKK